MTNPLDSNSSDLVALNTVRELAAAVSTQARISNRVWLALITAALVAIVPRPSAPGQEALLLPFGLGGIAPRDFYFVLFGVLVVLTIAFAAAHAQQVRAQELAQRSVDGLVKESRTVLGIHPRDYFDMVREPSVNRVAALSQLLRGKYQFYGDNLKCPAWLRAISSGYYFVLKLVSLIVYFGFPAWALWHTYARSVTTIGNGAYVHAGGLVALLALAQVAFIDTWNLLRVSSKLWHAGSPASLARRTTSDASPSNTDA